MKLQNHFSCSMCTEFISTYSLSWPLCSFPCWASIVWEISRSWRLSPRLVTRNLFFALASSQLWLIVRNFSPFAANVFTFIGLGFVLIYVFQDLPAISERPMFAPIERFPLYFGTVLFALEAVGVVIALENNMERPKSFGGAFGVLNIGMTIVTAMYGFVGFFGYIKYGDDSKDSITLNLPDGWRVITRLHYTIVILIQYFLLQAASAYSRSFRDRNFHLLRTSVLCSHLNYLGELRRREDQKLWQQHTISACASLSHHDFYVPCRRSRSRVGLVHQSFRSVLLEHSWTRIPCYHGNLCSLARQARCMQLDHVEGYWPCHFCTGWTRIGHLFIAHQHHRHIRRQNNLVNRSKVISKTEIFYINYQDSETKH